MVKSNEGMPGDTARPDRAGPLMRNREGGDMGVHGHGMPMNHPADITHDLKPTLTAQEAHRRDELMNMSPRSEEEEKELQELSKKGDVPPELSDDGKRRLAALRARGPLVAEDAAAAKRIADLKEPTLEQQNQLNSLLTKGPRSRAEEEEMKLLEKAEQDRANYEKERDEMIAKEAAGPFSIEQWAHIKKWARREFTMEHMRGMTYEQRDRVNP